MTGKDRYSEHINSSLDIKETNNPITKKAKVMNQHLPRRIHGWKICT
jgi:hypothetical protein